MNAWARIKKFCDRWQEPLVWLPVAIGALLAARWYLPQLDPSAGVDNIGKMFGLAEFVLTFAVASFTAWLAQVTYGTELSDNQRDMLIERGYKYDLFILALPWLQWFAVFAVTWWGLA